MSQPTSPGYFSGFPAQTDERELHKFAHYLPIYDRILADLAGKPVRFLEIGIFRGGSMRMWRDYFAPSSSLYFLDIDPNCQALALEGTQIRIGDQADPAFLHQLAAEAGPFDLIIDDGGHEMFQQKTSFQTLWPYLNDGGRYIVEDIHTSYWPGFGGGLRAPNSFMEFTKDLLDQMHSWYSEDPQNFPLHPLAHEIESLQYFDSIFVARKRLRDEPPTSLQARNGVVRRGRAYAQVQNKKSIFRRFYSESAPKNATDTSKRSD